MTWDGKRWGTLCLKLAAVLLLSLLLGRFVAADEQRVPLLKAGYLQVGADRSVAAKMQGAGLNAVWPKWNRFRPDTDDAATWRRVDQWIESCERHQLDLWPVVNFLGRDEEPALFPKFRREVSIAGVVNQHTPCPVDEAYWKAVVFPRFLAAAERSKTTPRLVGMVLDLEMYGADHSAYAWPCACEVCRKGAGSTEPQALLDWQRREVQRIASDLERKVHRVAPKFQFAAMHLEEAFPFHEGLAIGLGTAELPVVVAAERTYGTGETPEMARTRERLKSLNAHARFVGGLQLSLFPTDQLAPQLYSLGSSGDGFWLYTLGSLAVRSEEVPSSFRLTEPQDRYWSAFQLASRELDQWRATNGRHVSPLVAQRKAVEPRFTMTRRVLQPLFETLPTLPLPGEETHLRRLNLIYVLLDEGETLRIHAVARQGTQPDLDATVKLVEPDGKELWTRTVKLGSREQIEWKAPVAATYLVPVMAGFNECEVTIANSRAVFFAGRHQRLKLTGHMRPMFFHVAEGQKPTVEIVVEVPGEQARVRLHAPDGKVASDATVTGTSSISAEGPSGIWSVTATAVEGKPLGGVQIGLSPPLSPYMADAPERLLRDKK